MTIDRFVLFSLSKSVVFINKEYGVAYVVHDRDFVGGKGEGPGTTRDMEKGAR